MGAFLPDVWGVKTNKPIGIFYLRFFFDTALSIILTNIMLNIVTGIIIDEFGSLKDALHDKMEDIQNVCFICGIDRENFERNNIDFESHWRVEHYQWNYIFYIAYLMTKKPTDLTGTESYVFDHYGQKSLDWLPVEKASGIKDDNEEQDARFSKVAAVEKKVVDCHVAETRQRRLRFRA